LVNPKSGLKEQTNDVSVIGDHVVIWRHSYECCSAGRHFQFIHSVFTTKERAWE